MPNTEQTLLVTFDSRLGSTADVAAFIAGVIAETGRAVDVRPIAQVAELSPYGGVLIGGAIRYDRWLPGAVDFTQRHRDALRAMPVAFFFTCLTLARPTPDARRKAESYADQIRQTAPEIRPVSVGQFAGVLKFAGTPWPLRAGLRLLSLATGVAEGDYRDWDAIRDWAQSQLA